MWLVLGVGITVRFAGPTELYQFNAQNAVTQWFALLAAIGVPVVLFFVLAHVIRITQSMTEVAMRLAEPETVARDSIVTVGQAIRREVAAMGDAVERALARTAELETLVSSEVSALEHAYSDNEVRIRSLLQDLGSQRDTLVSQAGQVRDAINSVHLDLNQDISQISELIAEQVNEASRRITNRLAEAGEQFTRALEQSGNNMTQALGKKGHDQLDRLESTSQEAAQAITAELSGQLTAMLSFKTDQIGMLVVEKLNEALRRIAPAEKSEHLDQAVAPQRDGPPDRQEISTANVSDYNQGLSALHNALPTLVDLARGDRRPSFRDLAIAAGLDPGRDFIGASLRDLDFRDEDLTGFDFSEADLSGSDFRRAKVAGVGLAGADLTGAIGLAETILETTVEPKPKSGPRLVFSSPKQPSYEGSGVDPPSPVLGPAVTHSGWLIELLARASEDAEESAPGTPARQSGASAAASNRPAIDSLDSLAVEIAHLIDHDTAAEVWDRYNRGERNVFSRKLYTNQGQKAFEEIRRKYRTDRDFKRTVDRYIGEFERLLEEVSRDDRGQVVARTYLTSETGKLYTMIAHAVGRFD
jgi:hypothetical protein